ncbi:Transcriptional regulator OS=Streptomyces fumanus OX=67302 GN=GCM10018772_11580 PE=4 SV=1 [Streptomyces fumanus]
MHRSVARTLLAEGRLAEADASLARAAELYRTLQLRTELANCHWMRGYVSAQNGLLERAEAEFRQALAMLSESRAALYSSRPPWNWPMCCTAAGKSEEAAGLAGSWTSCPPSAARCTPPPRTGCSASSPRTPGTPRPPRSTTSARSACWSRQGAAGDLADLCRLLGDLLRRTGRVEAALDAYRTGLGHRTAPGTTTLGPAPAQPPL